MAYFVPVTDFADRTSHWLDQSANQPLIVTKRGKPTYTVFAFQAPSAAPEDVGVKGARILEVKTRDLSRDTYSVLDRLEGQHRTGVITRRGKARALIDYVDQSHLDRFAAAVLTVSPSFAVSRQRAEADLSMGRTRTVDEFIDELD